MITWMDIAMRFVLFAGEIDLAVCAVAGMATGTVAMVFAIGNRQAGVHVHSVTWIYVILKGEAENFDGTGNVHGARPLDCLYIPRGLPHGVRTVSVSTVA